MVIVRKTFFDAVRVSLFDGVLKKHQVAGLTAILDHGSDVGETDDRWLAYMLATAHHETGRTMQPVRETFAASDSQAIALLDSAFDNGRLSSVSAPYWRRDAEGKTWLGRGLVQLTHRTNYEKMTLITGIDLVSRPERAMEMTIAVDILFIGMETGAFTGRRLGQYFSGDRTDWIGARRIINGRDKAELVAGFGRRYLAAIRLAGTA
ncbi:hypothetical protein [Rhizobium herbae]|jgi:hypothetical protein